MPRYLAEDGYFAALMTLDLSARIIWRYGRLSAVPNYFELNISHWLGTARKKRPSRTGIAVIYYGLAPPLIAYAMPRTRGHVARRRRLAKMGDDARGAGPPLMNIAFSR